MLDTGFDYSARDQVMPHPYYGSQYWVGVVSPAANTIDEVRHLLDEAHRFAARKHANRSARGTRDGSVLDATPRVSAAPPEG
ncbi:hypothetical protein HKK74_14455 [Actinomadura alba]|uniref:DUF6194 domain-containing protein n=1 Tax=Actinomadura alba TaxID=406431 RepID=A0ABR7LPC3_9ACTN|nr:hypothetical protein [Actinomadura alba]